MENKYFEGQGHVRGSLSAQKKDAETDGPSLHPAEFLIPYNLSRQDSRFLRERLLKNCLNGSIILC